MQQVQGAIPLLMQSLPEIRPIREEMDLKRQRSQLITAIRGLQVIKRAVKTGTGADRLQFLQLDKYVDLLVMALKLDVDSSLDEADRMQRLALEILAAHQLDQPQTDHLLLLHENLLTALQQYFIRTVQQQQFKNTAKVARFLYDSAFSTYNPKILTYDPHCIFILQNVLNLKDVDCAGAEYEAQQAIKYAVCTVGLLSKYDELQLVLQHLYGPLLVQAIECNVLDDELIIQICEVVKTLFSQQNCIFQAEVEVLDHLLNLVSDIDSERI